MLSSSRPKVLIADDERLIADTLAMILNQSGFEARAVYTGIEAISLATQFRPDILISDVWMADISGVDAAIEICSLLPQTHVFLLSGRTPEEDAMASVRAKNLKFEVLIKPVRPPDLLEKLRAASGIPTRTMPRSI